MNRRRGGKWVVRSPVNEDVGVFTDDIVGMVEGRVANGLQTNISREFKVRERTLGNSNRKYISSVRNKSVGCA